MKKFLYNTLNEINLDYVPNTKALLEIYTAQRDQDLIITNKYLNCELIRLHQTSNLVDLIISEYMQSSLYDGQSEVYLEDINLDYTPHTKHLITAHLSYESEGTVEPTIENLMAELLYLYKRGELGYLFSGEWIYSPGGLELETNLELDLLKVELKGLTSQLRKELQLLNKFLLFQNCFRMINNSIMNIECKKNKYLNFDEEKNEIIFSDEPSDLIKIVSKGTSKKTYWELEERIRECENKAGEIINLILREFEIELPSNYRFSTFDD